MCTVKDSNYGISFVQPLVHSSQSAQSQSSQSQSQPQSQPSQAESDFLLFWDAKAVQKIVEEGIEHEKKCQSLSFTKPELSLLKGYCGTVKMTCKICHEQISTQSVESIDDDLFNQCSAKTLLFSSHLTFEFTYFFPFFLI